jgi:hypothetical protein
MLKTGSIYSELDLNIKPFQQAVKKAGKASENLASDLEKSSQKGSNAFKKTETSFNNLQDVIIGNVIADTLVSAFDSAWQSTQQFFLDSIDLANNYEQAMLGLEIIAPRFGEDADRAIQLAKELGRELRIGPLASSSALQDLLQSGLNLEQSSELLRRFTNEARLGKSANIDLQTAVSNLAQAYKTSNSELGDASGISENFSDIQERGLQVLQGRGKLLNKSVGQLSEAEKQEAQYAGMIDLTNLTLGASDEMNGSYSDNLSKLGYEFSQLQLSIGQFLTKILNPFVSFVANNFDTILIVFTSFSTILGILLLPVLKGLPVIIGTAISSFTALALPFLPLIIKAALVAAAILALKTAFDNNFLGIKDLVINVITIIQAQWQRVVDTFNNQVKPALAELKTAWLELWTVLQPLLARLAQELGFNEQNTKSLLNGFSSFLGFVVDILIIGLELLVVMMEKVAGVISYLADENTTAEKIMRNVWTAFLSFFQGLWDKISKIISTFGDNFKTTIGDWKNYGSDIIDSMVEGIMGQIERLKDTARMIGQTVQNAFKGELDMNSPSKKLIADGKQVVESYEIGIADQLPDLAQTSAEMGQTVLSQFDNTNNTNHYTNNYNIRSSDPTGVATEIRRAEARRNRAAQQGLNYQL